MFLLLCLFVVLGFVSLKFLFEIKGDLVITLFTYPFGNPYFNFGVSCYYLEDDTTRLHNYEVGLVWIAIVFSKVEKLSS